MFQMHFSQPSFTEINLPNLPVSLPISITIFFLFVFVSPQHKMVLQAALSPIQSLTIAARSAGREPCRLCCAVSRFSIALVPRRNWIPRLALCFVFPLQHCCKRTVLERSSGDSGDFRETGSSRIVKSFRNQGTFLGKGDIVEKETAQDAGLRKLKIMTYNVWFREDLEMIERMKALCKLIQQHSPDVICLQEVTPNIYSIFQKSNWWKAYRCSVSSEMSKARRYFCMQLSKMPVKSFSCKPFSNSIMGRELCVTEVEVGPGKTLVIATTHLESPCLAPPTWDQTYSKERVAQAKEALNFLKRSTNTIFAGDMNWDDDKDGQFPLPAGWTDAWTELRTRDHGFTYDTKSNKMLTGNRTLQKRLDRFFCNLHDFKMSEIDMVGLEAIPGLSYCKEKKVKQEMKKLTLPVLPSDHYGLVLTICKK